MALFDDLSTIFGAYATKINSLKSNLGNIANLDTSVKTSIVDAINAAQAEIDAAKTDLGAVNESLEEIIPVNLAKDVTYTESRALYYNDGTTFVSSDFATSGYIDISACSTIIYMRYCSTGTASKIGIAFYDANKSYLSGVRCVLSASTAGFVLSEEDVPENAKYIRIPCYKADAPTILYDKSDYDAKTLSRLEVAEADIETLEKAQAETAEKIDNVLNNGYFKLPVDKWERGGWLGYSSKDSRSYRVRYTETLVFDRDVYILADAGYNIGGHKSDGNALATGTMMKISANTSFKLYVRRLVEDATETADVATFAGKVKISTAFAPIEMYSPTFTDVSMFERMGISGDSYSAGGGIISGVTPLTWGKNLERQAGITVDIYAKSGDTIVTWNTNATKGLPALLAGAECGLYWFQHGINGTGSAESIGTPEDMSADPKPQTFYGQYAYAIEAVKTAFPKARIVIATITGSSWGLSQNTYAAANTAIKNIAEYEEIPCIDITEDDFFRTEFYSANIRSQHPTAMLAAGMAMAYRRLISKCIQKNPSYFINYGAD